MSFRLFLSFFVVAVDKQERNWVRGRSAVLAMGVVDFNNRQFASAESQCVTVRTGEQVAVALWPVSLFHLTPWGKILKNTYKNYLKSFEEEWGKKSVSLINC